MFAAIINDCRDDNAMGRQATRAAALLGCAVTTVGVQSDLEAGGNLVDMLDAADGGRGVVLVNVARRNGAAKHWPNGTPFGHFFYKKTVIVASLDGLTLSLASKLGVTGDIIRIEDSRPLAATSQFRSFELLPGYGADLLRGKKLAGHAFNLREVPDPPPAIWSIDCFGNAKSTLLPTDIGFRAGAKVKTRVGAFTCYERLKDVPNKKAGLVIGSSGLGNARFLEIVMQGVSAAEHFSLTIGDAVL